MAVFGSLHLSEVHEEAVSIQCFTGTRSTRILYNGNILQNILHSYVMLCYRYIYLPCSVYIPM